MKAFKTPEYSGIWLDFSGDRLVFRETVQSHLRKELNDPEGLLEVREDGPHWQGRVRAELSYSHTLTTGILVFSTTHQLGVDIESGTREFKGDVIKLSERFFPASETKLLRSLPTSSQKDYFLRLWVQKEAYAKITRLGLAKTLEVGLQNASSFVFKTLPVAPDSFYSCIALKELEEKS